MSRTETATTTPTRRQRVVARLLTKLQRLPEPTHEYTVTHNLRIPMGDGAVLLADLYAPVGVTAGTILLRSPYGFGTFIATMTGGVYASRGYHVLLARCRGTFGSGGSFDPFTHEVADAADTVEWMRQQPWFEGRFATHGGSYLGFTQWALLMDPPPELKAAVISIGPHDFHAAMYRGGAFNLIDYLGWSEQVSRQEEPNFAKLVLAHAKAQRKNPAAAAELPLVDASDRLLGKGAPWYQEWVRRRDPNDPLWAPMRLDAALERVQVPVLLQSGWQDPFLCQTFQQYATLRARDVDVALTIGPWTHGELVTKARGIVACETLAWFEEHLAGSGVRTRPSPVKVFVTGAEQWRDLSDWPPSTVDQSWYPTPGGRLDQSSPDHGSESTFVYDPADPTPTIGGSVLLGGGYVDDTKLADRDDVAVFTSAPLQRPLDVLGTPAVQLGHNTDNPHADLFVRLSDVDERGRSRNVTDGFTRLATAASNGSVRIELDQIAHRFAARHRIRLIVAGGSFPRYERNLGTSDDPATSARMAPSHRTIDLAASRLILPAGT